MIVPARPAATIRPPANQRRSAALRAVPTGEWTSSCHAPRSGYRDSWRAQRAAAVRDPPGRSGDGHDSTVASGKSALLARLWSLGYEHYDAPLRRLRPSLDVALAWADGRARSRTTLVVSPPLRPFSRRLVYRSVYECAVPACTWQGMARVRCGQTPARQARSSAWTSVRVGGP